MAYARPRTTHELAKELRAAALQLRGTAKCAGKAAGSQRLLATAGAGAGVQRCTLAGEPLPSVAWRPCQPLRPYGALGDRGRKRQATNKTKKTKRTTRAQMPPNSKYKIKIEF